MSACDISSFGGEFDSDLNITRMRMVIPNKVWSIEVKEKTHTFAQNDMVLHKGKEYTVIRFVLMPKRGDREEFDAYADISSIRLPHLIMVKLEDLIP